MVTKKNVKKSKKPVKKSKVVKSSKKKVATKKRPVKKQQPKKVLATHVMMILDCSSSMSTIRTEAIEHFNEQLEKVQAVAANMDVTVSLTTFNTHVTNVFFNKPLNTLQPLTLRTYVPSGSTALRDAIGLTVQRAQKEIVDDPNAAYLVVIVTDGEENSSTQFTADQIATLIKDLQETKRWTFTYLGANHNAEAVAQNLNIPLGNVAVFTSDAAGTRAATAMSNASIGDYFSLRSTGVTQTLGYYSPPSSDSENENKK